MLSLSSPPIFGPPFPCLARDCLRNCLVQIFQMTFPHRRHFLTCKPMTLSHTSQQLIPQKTSGHAVSSVVIPSYLLSLDTKSLDTPFWESCLIPAGSSLVLTYQKVAPVSCGSSVDMLLHSWSVDRIASSVMGARRKVAKKSSEQPNGRAQFASCVVPSNR